MYDSMTDLRNYVEINRSCLSRWSTNRQMAKLSKLRCIASNLVLFTVLLSRKMQNPHARPQSSWHCFELKRARRGQLDECCVGVV